ncbi:hypothetical protein PsorP6_003215 [Peronosclerospora sorghi]|uniref:Uncharacterized protein n=1 Tax=Peronosclerospora sorghi TaxID=230839 RepID=A0ACC0VNW4_9STRA|nr:hypothetical protein PsorP6_003215 [Peronosclerospora sorghi]
MTVTTDFTLDSGPAPNLLCGPRVSVALALISTFALGFTEASLSIKCRPIPFRFALHFAAVNILPSVVWRTISARYVAAASGVACSRLITSEKLDEWSRTSGKRLVLLKSVQALRMTIGSYGLALSLWHTHDSMEKKYSNEEDHHERETVVRFAPIESPLSRVSRRQHADHILTVPRNPKDWKEQGLDWNQVGLHVQVNGEEDKTLMKVVEVELDDPDKMVASTQQIKEQATGEENASVCFVAVLPLDGKPVLASQLGVFDIIFNPMAAVLTFIASSCQTRGVAHAFLIAEQGTDEESEQQQHARRHLSTSRIATGLLHRHGITTSVVSDKILKETGKRSGVVFVLAETLRAGQLRARTLIEQGMFRQEEICLILEESLGGQSAIDEACHVQSALLTKATEPELEVEPNDQGKGPTYMSVADVSDQTLQGIRLLLRKGENPDAIQAALYEAYGTQRVVAPRRRDQFSHMHV